MGMVPMPVGPQPMGPVLPTAAQPMGPVLPTAVPPPQVNPAQTFAAKRAQDTFESAPTPQQGRPSLQAASSCAAPHPQNPAALQAQPAAPAQAQTADTVQAQPTCAAPQPQNPAALQAQTDAPAQTAAPAQTQTAATAQAQTAATAQTANHEPVNEVAAAQARQGWETQEASVKQKTDMDCGEASLTFVAKASRGGDEEKKTEKEERDEVRKKAKETRTYEHVQSRTKVNLSDGASAEEVGAVLGSMGIGIQKGIGGFDSRALNTSLRQGKMVMAMVDSNAILNPKLPESKQTDEPGHLHWVTIDGYNRGMTSNPMDDYYRVRDPVHGSYWVSAKDLKGAIDTGREEHGSGGMLVLEKRRDKYDTSEEREELAKDNLDQAAQLGQGTGLGSRRLSASESS
jgi:chemotaxis protein histidine kinase CheA